MAKTVYKTATLLKYFKLNINVCNTMVYQRTLVGAWKQMTENLKTEWTLP